MFVATPPGDAVSVAGVDVSRRINSPACATVSECTAPMDASRLEAAIRKGEDLGPEDAAEPATLTLAG